MGGSRVLLWVAIVLVVAWFLYSVRSILFPFAFGLIVAALLDPSIRKLRKKGFSRIAAVLIIFVGFLAVVVGVGVLVAPRAIAQVYNVRENVTGFAQTNLFPPTRLEQFLQDKDALQLREKELAENPYPLQPQEFRKWLSDEDKTAVDYTAFFAVERQELREHSLPTNRADLLNELETPVEPGPIDNLIAQWRPTLDRLGLPTTRSGFEEMFQIKSNVNRLATAAFGGAAQIVQYLGSSILLLLITPIVTLFILLDYDNFRRRFVTWIPPAIRPAATDLLADLADVLSAYIRGLAKSVMLYTAIMSTLLTVLDVPYSLFLGLLVGAFYLIPYIGNFISVGVIWLALATGTTNTGVWIFDFGSRSGYIAFCLILFVVVGLLYDQLIHPRIVGSSVGLHPVVSFFVILSGGAIFGLAGMILAFPIAGMVKVILDRLIRYTTTTSGETLDLPRVPSRHTGT